MKSMNQTHLSQFQQQQYTQYLESQLQKFSAFMLSQKRQNQQLKEHSSILAHHTELISQMQQQLKLSSLQQEELLNNQNSIEKKQVRVKDMEIRLARLEDRDRFQCHQHTMQMPSNREEVGKEDKGMQKLGQRLRQVQETIHKMQQSPVRNNTELMAALEEQTAAKVKKAQKKLKKYFALKLQTIQELFLKPKKIKKTRSKSPSVQTPIQMSTMSRYEVGWQVEPNPSQFRLQDYSSKQEQSTILRDSHNSILSSLRPKAKKADKNQLKDRSKSKSKSKSQKGKGKEQGKKKRKQEKDSRSRSVSKSVTLSDNSFLRSSCSHSRSPSQSFLSKKSKKNTKIHNTSTDRLKSSTSRAKVKAAKKTQLQFSKSRSRSNHSGVSLHQKCKQRPGVEKSKNEREKKREKAKRH